MPQQKKIVGLIEGVKIIGRKTVKATALFDTGAKLSSIDTELAAKAQLGPVIRTQKIKAPITKHTVERPVVKVIFEIAGERYDTEANLNDRSHMKYPIIIGRNLIKGNFVVDVDKNPRDVKRADEKAKGMDNSS